VRLSVLEETSPSRAAIERARSRIAHNRSSAAVALTGGKYRPEDRITEKVENSKRLFRRRGDS
jgi:hypothetical protein